MKHKSFFIIMFWVNMLMVGCASQQPVINAKTRNDSIVVRTEYIHDTTMIEKIREIYNAPDTLFVHDSTVIYKYKDRVKIDTLYRYHTDTISIVEEKLIEKPIAPFVKRSCIALWIIIGLVIVVLIGGVIWKVATGNFSFSKLFLRK